MPGKLEFDVTLWTPEDYPNSAVITFPYDVVEVFGTKARIPVRFSVDGHVFRSSLAPMGSCGHIIPFNKEMRQQTGYKAGDTIHVILERDTEPRVVEVPEDVSAALKAVPSAHQVFQNYSYSHKKEVMAWINDAKKPETRLRRISKLVVTLSQNQKL